MIQITTSKSADGLIAWASVVCTGTTLGVVRKCVWCVDSDQTVEGKI